MYRELLKLGAVPSVAKLVAVNSMPIGVAGERPIWAAPYADYAHIFTK